MPKASVAIDRAGEHVFIEAGDEIVGKDWRESRRHFLLDRAFLVGSHSD